MENPSQADSASEDTLDDLIARAKRAHELVDAVDLREVMRHSATERAKIDQVCNALTDLAQGKRVDRVEGVDEVIADVDPEAARTSAWVQALTEKDLGAYIGRVMSKQSDDVDLVPLEVITHREGLPAFEVCVAPEKIRGDGCFGIFVSEHGVFAGTIQRPFNTHHWHIVKSQAHRDAEEACQIVAQYRRQAFDSR